MSNQPPTPHDPHDPQMSPHARHVHLLAQDEVLAQRADQLAAMLKGVRESVTALDERAAHIEERAERADQKAGQVAKSNRRAIIALVIVAIFTLVGGGLIVSQRYTVSRLNEEQTQSLELRRTALCPVYQETLRLSGVTPPGADPAIYAALVGALQHAVTSLQCPPLGSQ